MPSTAANCVIHHKGIYNITRLWHNYTECHISSFINHINSELPDGLVSNIRLKDAQFDLNLQKCLMDTDKDEVHLDDVKDNLAAFDCILGILEGFTYSFPHELNDTITSASLSTRMLLQEYRTNQNSSSDQPSNRNFRPNSTKAHRRQLRTLSALGVFSLEQLITPDGLDVFTWQQIHLIRNKRCIKGPTPR